MGVSNEEWKKLDRKAKSIIRLCVSDSVLLNVSGEATMKDLWDKLGTLYQSKSLVNKLFKQKTLYNPMMTDGDSVTEHLNAFNIVASQLLSVDIKILDEDKCISLLCFVLDSWDSLVIAISSNPTALQFGEIVSSLLTEGMRWKNMDSQNGASFHFTPHREWFYEYEKFDGGDVFFGDDRKARIVARRKVKLNLKGGRVRTLLSVLHILALSRNLISISKLDDAGVKTMFDKDTCKMIWGALVLMRGVRIGTLYKLEGSSVIDGCNSSVVPEGGAENLVVSGEKTMLWHQNLGHIGEKGL
eukprot:PITA_28948